MVMAKTGELMEGVHSPYREDEEEEDSDEGLRLFPEQPEEED